VPTAHALPAEVAVAPSSVSISAGPVAGFGLATTVQPVLVRCSVRVRLAVPSDTSPTAQAGLVAVVAAPFRKLSSPDVPALGLGTSFQRVPFQCNVIVRYAAPGSK